MFTITIVFGNVSCPLMFRDKEKANEAWVKSLGETPTHIQDEFGREVFVPDGMVCGAIFEDLQKSKEAEIEIALHKARTNIKAQQRATADPEIRAAQQGPAVLTPMGGMHAGPNGRFS